ncbi:UDP-N-acetylglucosamine 2-epimerase (non-hydrolyzing) [candidate division KSB1 bacterium]|nr:UDP-N-acetylglucosamine 2-epimerase (non-hydrolyzing) [candidate division KSB1 bacterium]
MQEKIKISLVIGTRPELIKVSPLLRQLEKSTRFDFQFINTGQHYDYEMDLIFCEELALPTPVFLKMGSDAPARQVGKAMLAIEAQLVQFQPDLVLVAGDTNSTLAGALTASKLNIPIAHLEAGLRSFDRSMPEEVNRVIVDHISRWLFVPTEKAITNLIAEGIDAKQITFTYDIHVDVLNDNFSLANQNSNIVEQLQLHDFILITCHRQSNTDDPVKLQNIVTALLTLSQKQDVVFPVHPRTRNKLIELNLFDKLERNSHLKLIKPVGFFDFLKLMGHAACVITDSGGVQKETLILKTPCITIRENTEWIETVRLGANVLVGSDPEKIVAEVQRRATPEFHQFMSQLENPYGNGQTTRLILDTIFNDFSRA